MLNIDGKPATILIIDDDPLILKLAENAFRERGYNTCSALNAKTGLVAVAKQKPDLIVLDILLPDIDGFTILEQLKSDQSTARIPVIMLTVKMLDCDVQRGLELGADDYIAKPLYPPLLVKRVENVLRNTLEE